MRPESCSSIERDIPPLPATVRARALARARAALAAGVVTRPAFTAPTPRFRWAAAAALVAPGSGAVGAATYEIRARLFPSTEGLVAPPVAARPAPAARAPEPALPEPAAPIAGGKRGAGGGNRAFRGPTRSGQSCACCGKRAPP